MNRQLKTALTKYERQDLRVSWPLSLLVGLSVERLCRAFGGNGS
jgi:hypothetical protein